MPYQTKVLIYCDALCIGQYHLPAENAVTAFNYRMLRIDFIRGCLIEDRETQAQ